jgi:hypothetical protein
MALGCIGNRGAVRACTLIVAGQPWGIVYGLGLWGAKIVTALGADLSSDLFWGYSPHAERIAEPLLWDTTSVTNIGLLYGALVASRWNAEDLRTKAMARHGAPRCEYRGRLAHGVQLTHGLWL